MSEVAENDDEAAAMESDEFQVLDDYPDDPEEARALGLDVSEDPLYDEAQDDRDAKWVAKRYKISARDTDAVLNCPACFSVCCWDCQKHDEYEQYRAMFVVNCRVYLNRTVRPVSDASATSGRRGGGANRRRAKAAAAAAAAAPTVPEEIFHPVHCNACNTELGARDADEVVHFFHVLASQP